jgi:hypothetical protein
MCALVEFSLPLKSCLSNEVFPVVSSQHAGLYTFERSHEGLSVSRFHRSRSPTIWIIVTTRVIYRSEV